MYKAHAGYSLAEIIGACVAVLFCIYFIFTAIQGDYGVLSRLQILTEVAHLESEAAKLRQERAEIENLTRRLSESYVDIDLLDERARAVLGYIRADELIIREE